MGFREEYRATLKCLEVEETIDLVVHRPLAFLVAKLAYRVSLTPNQLTALSVVLGVVGGTMLFVGRWYAPLVAAGLLFLSQVVDCSDGMLARMQKSASELGRMLDGTSDAVTMVAAVVGSVYLIIQRYPGPPYVPAVIAVLAYLTVQTSMMHTTAYDHYKNVFVRMTVRGTCDSEDVEQAVERHALLRGQRQGLVLRFAWWLYVGYLKRQRRFLRWFDPHTVTRMGTLPPWDQAVADGYRRRALGPMRVWRSAFGVGALVFGFALFNAVGRPDLLIPFRLLLMNAVFFLYLMPAQRRASREAFREVGLVRGQPAAQPESSEEPWAAAAREKHA
jgi:phosphatidylglycerophosphate synthase